MGMRIKVATIYKTQDTHDDFKYGVLQAAAKAGFSQVARALLTTCPQIDNRAQGKTPLIISAGKGHEATVGMLLEIGMDTGATDIAGQSALHHAAKNGHTETVRLLVENRAKSDLRDSKGQTALSLAILKWYV
jgi:ankyrin